MGFSPQRWGAHFSRLAQERLLNVAFSRCKSRSSGVRARASDKRVNAPRHKKSTVQVRADPKWPPSRHMLGSLRQCRSGHDVPDDSQCCNFAHSLFIQCGVARKTRRRDSGGRSERDQSVGIVLVVAICVVAPTHRNAESWERRIVVTVRQICCGAVR